jgi:hypothetical protein
VWDKLRGNLLKLDERGVVRAATHGTRPMAEDEAGSAEHSLCWNMSRSPAPKLTGLADIRIDSVPRFLRAAAWRVSRPSVHVLRDILGDAISSPHCSAC